VSPDLSTQHIAAMLYEEILVNRTVLTLKIFKSLQFFSDVSSIRYGLPHAWRCCMAAKKNIPFSINQNVSAKKGSAFAVGGDYIAPKTSNWHMSFVISITCLVLIGAGIVLTVEPSGKVRIETEPSLPSSSAPKL
jgi:hypothetical protein